MNANFRFRLLSELIGTALLLCIVIGSGIMGVNLSQGNDAIALLANTLATVFGLYVLIELFGPLVAHISIRWSPQPWCCLNVSRKRSFCLIAYWDSHLVNMYP